MPSWHKMFIFLNGAGKCGYLAQGKNIWQWVMKRLGKPRQGLS